MLVPAVTFAYALLGAWRSENPSAWQPPYLAPLVATVFDWLPWYAWMILSVGFILVLTFEGAHRELRPVRVPANRDALIEALTNLEDNAIKVVNAAYLYFVMHKDNPHYIFDVQVREKYAESKTRYIVQQRIAGDDFILLSFHANLVSLHVGSVWPLTEEVTEAKFTESREGIRSSTNRVLSALDKGGLAFA